MVGVSDRTVKRSVPWRNSPGGQTVYQRICQRCGGVEPVTRITFDEPDDQGNGVRAGVRLVDRQDERSDDGQTWVRGQDDRRAMCRSTSGRIRPRLRGGRRGSRRGCVIVRCVGRSWPPMVAGSLVGWGGTATAGVVIAYARLWSTAHRGLGRLVAGWWHWLIDDRRYADSREDLHRTGKGDPVAIQEGHQARQRSHLLVSLAVILSAVGATVWHLSVEPLVSTGQLVAAVAVAGGAVGVGGA